MESQNFSQYTGCLLYFCPEFFSEMANKREKWQKTKLLTNTAVYNNFLCLQYFNKAFLMRDILVSAKFKLIFETSCTVQQMNYSITIYLFQYFAYYFIIFCKLLHVFIFQNCIHKNSRCDRLLMTIVNQYIFVFKIAFIY